MSQLIPFQFDGAVIRVLDIDGEPWFVGKDIAGALGYTNPQKAVRDHCRKARQAGVNDSFTPIDPQTVVIGEPDLFRLIVGSKLPAAERFESWVFEEVLPTVRRTGSYAAAGPLAALPAQTHDRVSAILLIGEAIAKVPGVKPGIAMAATLTCVRTNTGIEIEELRRALPPADEPLFTHNASKLGKVAGASAKAINLQLAGAGLQRKNERGEWELTEHGQEWAEAYPFSRHGHAGYQILWDPAVLDWMRKAA